MAIEQLSIFETRFNTPSYKADYYQMKTNTLEAEEAENINLVRLRLITHNARLVDARKELGMTQPEMAQAAGVHWFRLHRIETLKVVPTEDEMCKIACVLEKPIDYLFSEELLAAVEAGVFSRRKVELSGPRIVYLTEALQRQLITDGGIDAAEEEMNRQLLAERINDILEALEPREQLVLRLRFGLDGEGAKTLETVGREFGVTRDRIRQIEAKALRKLRHPTRSRKLKDYLG